MKVKGFWKGETLYWQIGEMLFTDAKFKQWLLRHCKDYSYPYDGIIRQHHIDLWRSEGARNGGIETRQTF
jgi:hypothetical protein